MLGAGGCSGTAGPQTGNGGASAVGGDTNGAGGATTAGGTTAPAIGGNATGGKATGGKATGGSAAGGNATGGKATGGSAAGGNATGGKATGGSATGGNATGGKATGGSAAGGNATGGKATGGSATGGNATGGKATGGSATGGSAGSQILEPVTGALLGLYYGDASITATASKLGRTVPLHLTYYAFSDDWTTGNTAEDIRAGRIPFVNWELFGATLDDIAGGTYDAILNQRAAAAKTLAHPFFLDFGAEMNGDWSPWSGAENGKSAAKYLAAYRHVHDLFVSAGATNAIWAFCPNVTSVPDASWNDPLDYYPGDTYVDWMCVDGYNWGTSQGDTWQSFYQVFKDIYPVLASKNKPIIIGEMASTELGGDKAAWISQIIPTMKEEFPLLKGLVWFDVNKETDWRISSSAASEAAFKTMANDAYFVQ
jgi:hypothetical protein